MLRGVILWRILEINMFNEFAPILQLMVFVFFALQLERINYSLKDITKSLNHLTNKIESDGLSVPKDVPPES